MTLKKEDILLVEDSITVWLLLSDGYCSVKLSIPDFCPNSSLVFDSCGHLKGVKLESLASCDFGKQLYERLRKQFNLV